MFLAAVMVAGRAQSPVKVRNMSPQGAQLETTLGAPSGTRFKLVRGRLVAEGVIVWASKNRYGVKFDFEVSVKDWLAGPAKAEQDRVDDVVSLIRAGRAMPPMDGAELAISTESHQSTGQLASDLEAVVNLIQDLEDDLAAAPETLIRHQVKLQSLDIAMQMLRAIAEQLRRAPREQASFGADLGNLRAACGQALEKRLS